MKIFRKLRFNSIKLTGFKKYIIYALGEILLVVIGILIALAVNNRNEQNKSYAALEKTSHIVLQKMKKDTSEIKVVLRNWDRLDTIIDQVLYDVNINDPIVSDCDYCLELLYSAQIPTINKGIDDVIKRAPIGTNTKLEESLLTIDDLYREISSSKYIYDQSVKDALIDNLNYLKLNKPWFSGYMAKGTCNEDCMDYMRNSWDFRNRVAYLTVVVYDSYYAQLILINNSITKQIVILEKQLSDEETIEEELFEENSSDSNS